MAPRFSVLLATHDRPALLPFAIASILAQTDPDFELLVVGDGCTDETASVVARFGDPRVRWFDLPKAPGFGYANRNVALRHSTGEYLAFVADDDLIFPDHLAVLAATLDRDDAEWAYSRPLWVSPDGVVVPFASNLSNADELDTFLTEANHIPATCVVYRRRCLETYGYWPEDVLRAGDWRYWIRIIEGGGRRRFACSTVPTSLHFNADWKTTADSQMPQVARAGAIARNAPWWPASMRVAVPPGVPGQRSFAELIGGGDYVDRLRQDVGRVVDRLAWIHLNEADANTSLLAADLAASRAALNEATQAVARLDRTNRDLAAELAGAHRRLQETQSDLETVLTSKSWRITAPLRAVTRALGRRRASRPPS